jgi:hypothetical protein
LQERFLSNHRQVPAGEEQGNACSDDKDLEAIVRQRPKWTSIDLRRSYSSLHSGDGRQRPIRLLVARDTSENPDAAQATCVYHDYPEFSFKL